MTRTVLTEVQERAREDFMRYWHEVLPHKYHAIERFNHSYPMRGWHPVAGRSVLEIGCGLGEHIRWERPIGIDYHVMDIRPEMIGHVTKHFPQVKAHVADIQDWTGMQIFDRVIAIHVLEHLPYLRSAIANIRHLLKPGGRLDVVIPCEGGLAYSLARRISAQRIFERRYGMPYGPIIATEHLHRPMAIIRELERHFTVEDRAFWPLPWLSTVDTNLVIGLRLCPLSPVV